MFTRKSDEQVIMGAMPKVHFAVPNGKDFLLTEYSTDTVFRFTPEQQLIPVLVREPSIQEMEPKIILHSWFETDKYLFFSINKLEIDWATPSEFPDKGLLMEKSTDNIYQSNVEMKDYKEKSLILGPSILSRSLKDTKTGYMPLPVSELMEANEAGKLSGKLKEIADNLSENEDYLLMILRFN